MNKSTRESLFIILIIISLFFGLCYLKYIEEKYSKNSKHSVSRKEGIKEDLYEIL